MSTHAMPRAVIFGIVAMLGGCAGVETDPFYRTDLWQPEGASAGNLAAMLVDPRDLIHGRGTGAGSVKQADAAVDRLWHGQTAPLQAAQLTEFKTSTAATGGGAAAAIGGAD